MPTKERSIVPSLSILGKDINWQERPEKYSSKRIGRSGCLLLSNERVRELHWLLKKSCCPFIAQGRHIVSLEYLSFVLQICVFRVGEARSYRKGILSLHLILSMAFYSPGQDLPRKQLWEQDSVIHYPIAFDTLEYRSTFHHLSNHPFRAGVRHQN